MSYSLNELADKIKDLDYIVLRNWKDLPKDLGEPGHEDLDLFVTQEDYVDLKNIILEFDQKDKVDIWSPKDDYFPKTISRYLTAVPREFEGFKIPSKVFYFESLYYHNAVHKPDDPYREELRRAFLDAYPPIRCIDPGVGHYV